MKFRLTLLLALLGVLPAELRAQGAGFHDTAWKFSAVGTFPATGATITVCPSTSSGIPCAPVSSVFLDKALTQPCSPSTIGCLTADGKGNFSFYVAPGDYIYTVTGTGITGYGPVPFSLGITSSGANTFTSTTNFNAPAYFGSGSPWIDVKSSLYGAKCDGTTDDATAINAASTAGSSGVDGASSNLYFPTGSCDVKSQIVNKQRIVFHGEDGGSRIVADATFPVSTPIVQVGNVALNNATRVEHLTIDCASVTGSIGLSTTTAQEQSGADYATVQRCMNFGVDVESNSQNSVWSHMNVVNSASAPATAEGFHINTNAAVKTSIFDSTFTPGGGAGQLACVRVVSGVLFAYGIHCENVVDGIRFDSGTSFGAVHGYTGASNITNAVKLNTGTGGVFLSEIMKNGGTNAVNDVDCSFTLTDNIVPLYAHSHTGSKCAYLDSTGFNATTIRTAGQLFSTITPGTAPFVVTSTTLVPNLNTQVLNGVTVTGTPSAGQVLTYTSPTAASPATPAGLFTAVTVTPVTSSVSTTGDQNLMFVTVTAGSLNSVNRTLLIQLAGVYSTPAASTAVLTHKLKLCTVSGCGSGTVVTLASWATSALGGIQVTNDPYNAVLNSSTQTAGASAAFEAHGNLTIDLAALATAAENVFADNNTATVGTIDSTAQLFLQHTIAFSAASGSNSATDRQMIAGTVD